MDKILCKRSYKFWGEVIFLITLCLLLYSTSSFAAVMGGEIDIHQNRLPTSNDAFIIHFKAHGLTPSGEHFVKGRIKQNGSYFGSTWNPGSQNWRRQSDSWTSMPSVTANASGEINGFLYMRSSANLAPNTPLTLEITLRLAGSTINLGPINSATLDSFSSSATGDGLSIRGRALMVDGRPAENKILTGIDEGGNLVCLYSTENNEVLEGSNDLPGTFSLPCPLGVKRIEMKDSESMLILGSADVPAPSSPGLLVDVEINDQKDEIHDEIDQIGPDIAILRLSANRLIRLDTLIADLTVSDASSEVDSVQYAIDGPTEASEGFPTWVNALPSDGSYDSNEEKAEISIAMQDFSSGEHQILIRAVDNEGNFGPVRTSEFKIYDAKFLDASHGTEFYYSQSSSDCVFLSKDGTVLYEDKCMARSEHNGITLIRERADNAFLIGSLDLSMNKAHLILIKKSNSTSVFFHNGR